MLKPAQRVADLPSHFFAQLNQRISALQAQGAQIIRLDAGSPDLPPHASVLTALKQATDDPTQHNYGTYVGLPAFRQAIIEYYDRRFGVKLAQNEVQPLIGSKEGIANIHLAWLNPGELVLIPDPGYSSYEAAPVLAGGRVATFPLLPERGWLPNLANIPTATAQAARMMWLNYPNNPTGAAAPLSFFYEAVEFCKHYEILLCHDAPYTDVTFEGYVAPSVLEVPGAKEIALEFNSLSKTYNMAGWRVGMAVGYHEAVQALAKIKTQVDSGLAKPIQHMATQALTGDQSWVAERNVIYQARRDLCLAAFAEMGLEALPPKGGLYVWFRTPAGYTSAAFQQYILETAHVALSPGSMYGQQGEGWMRLSFVSDNSVLDEALSRLKKLLTR